MSEHHCECGHEHHDHEHDCCCQHEGHEQHNHDCQCGHSHHDDDNQYEQAFSKYELHLSDEKVSNTVREIIAQNREKYNTPEVLRTLLSTVELTTLTVPDSHESVFNFTERQPLERPTSRPSTFGNHLRVSQFCCYGKPKSPSR